MTKIVNIQNEMVPYRTKQTGKELLKRDFNLLRRSDNKVIFTDNNEVTFYTNSEFDCTCSAHQNEEKLVCEHIYAAYLLEQEELKKSARESLKERILEQESQTFLSLFQTNLSQQLNYIETTSKKELLVEYYLKIKLERNLPTLLLEIKVGKERAYVVKNMKDFLQAIRDHRLVEFTKNFTYDPSEYTFSEEDSVILAELMQISDIAELYDREPLYFSRSYKEDKALVLPPNLAAHLLKLLAERDLRVQVIDHKNELMFKYDQVYIKSENPDFIFTLKKKIDSYQLDIEALQQIIFLEPYQMLFTDGTFYHLQTQDWQYLKPMREFQKLTNNEVALFQENQLSEVISFVLPVLEKNGHVIVDESISDRIIKEKLVAELFVSFENDKHVLKLKYRYGEQTFDPFETDEITAPNGRIIIRDIEKETKIMQMIENAPVHVSGKQMVVNSNDNDLYQFYYHVVPQLTKEAEVYLADGLEEMIAENIEPTTSLELSQDNDYLSVSFDFAGIDDDDIHSVLESLREKRSFHCLKNGHFLSLEAEPYKQMENIFDLLDIRKKDVKREMTLPIYRGVQIYETLDRNLHERHQKISKNFRTLIAEINTQSEQTYKLPKGLQAELRDYQVAGFEWMKTLARYQLGGVLADDMGLGKTVQAISFLVSEYEENPALNPVLIVTPASLLYNWYNEWSKFAPHIPVTVIHGSSKERRSQIEKIAPGHIYLVSYPTLRQDETEFLSKTFSSLILDESQTIKNYHTKASKVVRSLAAQHIFALSGTPLENSIDELWTTFQTIMPGFFPSLRKFREIDHAKVARMIRPFLLRRMKKDVVKELPKKIETNLYSELTEDQKRIYLAYLEKIQKDVNNEGQSAGEERMKLLAGLTRLRQICCDPSLFIENYQGDSSKVEQLFDTIKAARENGNRILIFPQFTSMLGLIRARCEQEKISYFYMDGETAAKKRIEKVNRFNAGEQEVFLISLKSGGTGLNLTGADMVILFDLWWNPAVEEQAAGRAHRIGQKRVVQVIRMITSGTIEEKIYNLQQKKQALVDRLIQPGDHLLGKLSTDELKEILAIN